MEIKDLKDKRFFKIGDFDAGDIFEENGQLYMKIKDRMPLNNSRNAVALSDGSLATFIDEDLLPVYGYYTRTH